MSKKLVTVALVFVLAGCPGESSSGGPPSGPKATPALALTTEAEVMAADATQPEVQAALSALATDRSKRAGLRYACVRRLEEKAPAAAVSLAERLALDTSRSEDAEVLRKNSIASLVRIASPEAQAALGRVKASSLDSAVLVARLTRKEGH